MISRSKIEELTEKLREKPNKDRIIKNIEELYKPKPTPLKKPYSNRRKQFMRHPDLYRKLGS